MATITTSWRKERDAKRKQTASSAVVYMSRVPPGMEIGALRALLSRTGKLGRIWLRPEDPEKIKERKALGGRRRSGYIDGWIEYTRKSDARTAVALLNGRAMNAAKRGGRWANDLWCLKLLKKYSWDDLIEETCGTKRERVLRIKAEVAAARREKHFVEERAALAKRIGINPDDEMPVIRRFKQKSAVQDAPYEDDPDEKRAREAQERLDNGEMNTAQPAVDNELVSMLFKGKPQQQP